MPMQWDATSLMTCAKFQINDRFVIDYALDAVKIVIATEIYQETVIDGLQGGYPDAVEIKTRIEDGSIEIRPTTPLSDGFEEVLDLYKLQEGDKAVVRLALQAQDIDVTVTDDRLLYLVLHRCKEDVLFLPDFIEQAVEKAAFDTLVGQQLLQTIRPRLSEGFVEHSLRRLQGVI